LKKATLYTDNLIKSRFAFRRRRKKKSAFCFSKTSKLFKFANRQISQQKLSIDFKKPFNFLANLPAEARGEAPSEATNRLWWCLLEKVNFLFAASLRSAAKLNGELSEKINFWFCIVKENFL